MKRSAKPVAPAKVANDQKSVPVLTVGQISERWQCCRRTVMDHIYKGKLNAFRLGRNWRVLLVEVERFERAKVAA